MNKKAALRIKSILDTSENKLKSVIDSLNPSDLGEIRELFRIYLQEVKKNYQEELKTLKSKGIKEPQLTACLDYKQAKVNKSEKILLLLDKRFEKRQSEKCSYQII